MKATRTLCLCVSVLPVTADRTTSTGCTRSGSTMSGWSITCFCVIRKYVYDCNAVISRPGEACTSTSARCVRFTRLFFSPHCFGQGEYPSYDQYPLLEHPFRCPANAPGWAMHRVCDWNHIFVSPAAMWRSSIEEIAWRIASWHALFLFAILDAVSK